jgi:hypothetical protein
MKLGTVLTVSVTAVCVQVFFVSSRARADEHERRAEERREMRHEEHNDQSCFLATCSHF